MILRPLADLEHDRYDDFLKEFPRALLFHSSMYLQLVGSEVSSSPEIMIVEDDKKIVGSLAVFAKKSRWGEVVNSSPYYGSNGGIVATDQRARALLWGWWEQRVKEAASSTYITTPHLNSTEPLMKKDDCIVTERITHINELKLPPAKSLMDCYHHKTRNMVRKAEKVGIKILRDDDDIDTLYNIHVANMAGVGGKAKQRDFFERLKRTFKKNDHYRIYYATHDGQKVAGLLLLYFNKTVEYFTPVIDHAFRDHQPLSLLIYEAMQECCRDGWEYWNWGGTWKSQESLYRFKERWGGVESRYSYFTHIGNRELLKATRQELENELNGFFVLPYERLQGGAT